MASLGLGTQPPPNIPGLAIQRELAYDDARKSALNDTFSLIRASAMAGMSCRAGSSERATQGWVAASYAEMREVRT
jgi:hypothetical protein